MKEVWKKSAGELDEMWQMFVEFQDCFAFEEEELGSTHLVQHTDTREAMHPI